jgi:hypothetical protein
MSSETELYPEAVDILKKYFVFDKVFNLCHYDQNFELLYQELLKLKKDSYSPNYRFIFLHHETEYFLNHYSPGFTIINLQRVLQKLDISNGFCLIISQQDLTTQLELVRQQESNDSDAIGCVQTGMFVGAVLQPWDTTDIGIDNIHKVYASLNGVPRFHRRVLVSLLKEKNLLDHGFVSYNSK